MLKFIGLIPARGGSKGVLRKNIRVLAGKPLVAWTIEAARQCRYLDRVVVSTDDEEIAAVCRHWGAEVPFLRPAELAQDSTPTLPVMQNVVSLLEGNDGYRPDVIVLLQPTSPLRLPSHIDEACALMTETGAQSVCSLSLAQHSPYWMVKIDDGRVRPFVNDAPEYTRRQDLPPVYIQNGAVIAVRRDTLMVDGVLLGEDTRPIVMDHQFAVDVDSMLDFKLAELLLQERLSGNA